MTYRAYALEFKNSTAEIGTAISNEDDTPVVVITMYRPTMLSISTKDQLENLYNFLDIREDDEKTRIVLKRVDGRPLARFVDSTKLDHATRVQIALELLKKLLRYDDFPNAIKYTLIDDDQIVFNEEGVWLREIVNYTDREIISDKEVVSMVGRILRMLLPDSSEVEMALIHQMENKNNDFFTIGDAYSAFRDVFIYEIPVTVEKRYLIYSEDGPAISYDDVNAYIVKKEKEKTAELQRLKTEKMLKNLEQLDQKIDHEAEVTIATISNDFNIKEVPIDEDYAFADIKTDFNLEEEALDGFSLKRNPNKAKTEEKIEEKIEDQVENEEEFSTNTDRLDQITKAITSSFDSLLEDNFEQKTGSPLDDLVQGESEELRELGSESEELYVFPEKTQEQKDQLGNTLIDGDVIYSSFVDHSEDGDSLSEGQDVEGQDNEPHGVEDHELEERLTPLEDEYTDQLDIVQDDIDHLDVFYGRMEENEIKKQKTQRIITVVIVAIMLLAVVFFGSLILKKKNETIEPHFSAFKETQSLVRFENNSKGEAKTLNYVWEIYFNDDLIEKVERKDVKFNFKQEGVYKIYLTAIGKDGEKYGPYSLDYEFKFKTEDEK